MPTHSQFNYYQAFTSIFLDGRLRLYVPTEPPGLLLVKYLTPHPITCSAERISIVAQDSAVYVKNFRTIVNFYDAPLMENVAS